MRKRLKSFIIALLLILMIIRVSDSSAETHESVRVGISPFSPFVILSDDDEPQGISIDLWRALADRIEMDFEFVVCKGVADKLGRLHHGEIDIAIGGITITEEREELYDFSHPLFHSGLDILIPFDARPALTTLFASLFKGGKIIFFAGLLTLVIIAGHIIWLVERSNGRRTTSFSEHYAKGVWEGMYWALVTASTVGYGDKVPRTWTGRVLTCVIILLFLPLFGYFIAQLSSDITLYSIRTDIRGAEDLAGKHIGVVSGTTSYETMKRHGIYLNVFDRIEDAYEAIDEGRIDAVVYDAPSLLFYANGDGRGRVKVVGKPFAPQDYGVALKAGSPHRETINRNILALIESGEMRSIKAKWFGAGG